MPASPSLIDEEMKSSEASPSIPFRSKKPLKSAVAELDPLSAKTPEKPPQLSRRTRSSNVAFSLKQVRKAAENPRSSRTPARRRIVDCPPDEDVAAAAAPKLKRSASLKLPEMYELLCEFFNNLDNSIKLLRLRGSASSFSNISPQIECFTDRRFTYTHLAQLKFILPEVIETKKTLVFDERSSCMKPDLLITMNLETLKDELELKSKGVSIFLKSLFRARLVDFLKNHPEGQEVPEETLPGEFNLRKQYFHQEVPKPPVPSETSSLAPENLHPASATHLPHPFRRSFCQKLRSNKTEEETPTKEPSLLDTKDQAPSEIPCVNSTPEKLAPALAEKLTSTPANVASTPVKLAPAPAEKLTSTPANVASTPARLMTVTPGLCPPKRSYLSPDGDSASSPNKLVRRASRSRSLKFDSPVKKSNLEVEASLDFSGVPGGNNEILDVLPKNLVQSIREKERIAKEEQNPAISQAKKRRHTIACLPKIFNIIHFFFQSISRSVITKEELIHKIISSHSDIIDRKEVEEQLSLLLEIVPDWISEKLTSGGDLLLRIRKTSDPNTIRARLREAI